MLCRFKKMNTEWICPDCGRRAPISDKSFCPSAICRLPPKDNVHQKQRLERFVVTETEKPKNHVHMIVETPIHISKDMMLINIIESLHKTKGLGKMDIRNIRYKTGMIEYLCKELQPNMDSIDWENSFFKGRN